MNKTTELKKEIEEKERTLPNFYDCYLEKLKSELKGRLDVLKDEVKFWNNISLCETFRTGSNKGYFKLKERIEILQKEIKQIEENGSTN